MLFKRTINQLPTIQIIQAILNKFMAVKVFKNLQCNSYNVPQIQNLLLILTVIIIKIIIIYVLVWKEIKNSQINKRTSKRCLIYKKSIIFLLMLPREGLQKRLCKK